MSESFQKIAVIGSGAAGSTAAWLLSRKHEVDVFESESILGGHTHTVSIEEGDVDHPVDMGFIVMNHRNYPILTRIFEQLKIELDDSDMSFSYHEPASGVCYAGTNLRSLFATAGNLVSSHHYKMVYDILKFNRLAKEALDENTLEGLSLTEFLDQSGLGQIFRHRYVFPMGAAIWSALEARISEFPAKTYIQFFKHHGLLDVKDRPQWRFVKGGSHTYIHKMRKSFNRYQCDAGVIGVSRDEHQATLRFRDGKKMHYDQVVLATHADQALALLQDPSDLELSLLSPWSYQLNDVTLHADESLMPASKKAWASWNVRRSPAKTDEDRVCVTYHMNRLQNLQTRKDYFVSLNLLDEIDEKKILVKREFDHPVFSYKALESQTSLPGLNGLNRTFFCGSYFGYGFHEDAVRSAVELANHFSCKL